MTELDPRLGIGGNNPPLPEQISITEDLQAEVTTFLETSQKGLSNQVAELLDEARLIPKEIDNDDDMGKAAKLIKRLRDLAKNLEATHAKEKAPYFRSSQSCDNFFFSMIDKVAKRAKPNKPGAADILQTRVDDYNQRKLAREQELRRQEAAKAAKEAAEKKRLEDEAAAKAEADRLAAERARKPETTAAKEAVADLSEVRAAEARAETSVAIEKAQEARVATLAKPADIVRTRVEDGPTVTMATEPYAIVEDFSKLDLAILRPFIKQDALEQALRAWAKTTNFNTEMPGALIGRRPKTVIR